MRIETLIGFPDQLAVKPLLTATGFVTGDEQNGSAFWIEGEGYAPNAIGSEVWTKHVFSLPVLMVGFRLYRNATI
jgi:hypothetical protein